MDIILNVDGSFCDRKNKAAYAAWLDVDNISIKHSARIKASVESSNAAEMIAVINGLCLLKRIPDLHLRNIIIVSDSQHAIRIFNEGGKVGRYGLYKIKYIDIVKILSPKSITFERVRTRSTEINRWCDKHARETLRRGDKRTEKRNTAGSL